MCSESNHIDALLGPFVVPTGEGNRRGSLHRFLSCRKGQARRVRRTRLETDSRLGPEYGMEFPE